MSDVVRYHIEHVTQYLHSGDVSTSSHLTHLRPRDLPHQRLLDHALVVEPTATDRRERVDYFGNTVEQFAVITPYDALSVIGRSHVEMSAIPMPDAEASVAWEGARDRLAFHPGAPDDGIAEFSYESPYVEITAELASFARPSFPPRRPLVAAAIDLMHRIHEEFTFDQTATSVTTPITRVLEDRHGVCQDFAHLQIGCLRAIGLPARYVSGYLVTDPPPGEPRLIGADASHAWLAVHCPRLGWVDLDPTNDVVPDVRHITLAWGRDYGDVSPLRGVVLGGGEQILRVGVSVIPGW